MRCRALPREQGWKNLESYLVPRVNPSYIFGDCDQNQIGLQAMHAATRVKIALHGPVLRINTRLETAEYFFLSDFAVDSADDLIEAFMVETDFVPGLRFSDKPNPIPELHTSGGSSLCAIR
jgi:hypothetical protein